MPRLIKSAKIVRIPKRTSRVDAIIHLARMKACERAWNKVIVIGQGSDGVCQYITSGMDDNHMIGMLERVKMDFMIKP